MRVILGLALLAASVQAQTTVTPSGPFYTTNTGGTTGVAPTNGYNKDGAGLASLYATQTAAYYQGGYTYLTFGSTASPGVNGAALNSGGTTYSRIQAQSFTANNLPTSVSTVYFQVATNAYTQEIRYNLYSNSVSINNGGTQGICDLCATSTNGGNCQNPSGTNGATSATVSTPTTGTKCASMTGRVYTISNIAAGASLQFQLSFLDYEVIPTGGAGTPTSNSNSLSIFFTRPAVVLVGDPQIVGMQGQDFQVHGMPDEIFNMVTYPNVQVNARFTYLSEAECADNYTTCFAHPGTYISEQGIRVGKDKVHVVAGSTKKGLTVRVNGKKVHQTKTALKLGEVEIVNHRRVVIKTPIAAFTMTNSDKFMNQEINMFDEKLLALGAERTMLKDGETFHSEVPLHGLQGQTWRNVEYPSGLEYEGSIMDYHVVDGNLFGTDFVFNKFNL